MKMAMVRRVPGQHCLVKSAEQTRLASPRLTDTERDQEHGLLVILFKIHPSISIKATMEPLE